MLNNDVNRSRTTDLHRYRRGLCSAVSATALLALGACSTADIGSNSAFTTDSFASPTEHGELMFGGPNHAGFTQSQRFHSWTFALSADASIDLKTELFAHNLDTVMYLYRRDPGQTQWGSNIASNDDYEGQMWSRLVLSLGAGEYRLKVKAAKTTFTGDFAVLAGCEGDGCPAVTGGTCSPDHPATLPEQTQFTIGCSAAFRDVLLAPVEEQWSSTVAYDDRCDMGGVVAKAIDFYREYWEGLGFWGDLVEEENPQLNVKVVEHGTGGTVVGVDLGMDEDYVDFVFDGYGGLVMLFHHQSYSEEQWFCGQPGEQQDDEPGGYDEDCAGNAIEALPHEASSVVTGQGSTTMGSPDVGLPTFLQTTVWRFTDSEVALEHEDDPIAYSYVMWTSVEGEKAAEVTLSAKGTTMSYLAGETYGDGGYIFMAIDGGVPRFVCDEGY